jgi:hypothetical protein
MAGTYGEPGKNPYSIPGIVGQYSNVVNAATGVTQIYQKSSQFRYTSIGTYNPSTKKFTPDPNASLSTDNIKILSNQSSIDAVKGASIIAAIVAGLDPTKAQQLITPNAATGGVTSGTTPVDLGVKGTGKKSNFGDHRYPLDIAKIKQDKIVFSMLQYSPRGFQFTRGSSETLGGF